MEEHVPEESVLASGACIPIDSSRRGVHNSAAREDREKSMRMAQGECLYLVGVKSYDVDRLIEAAPHYLRSLWGKKGRRHRRGQNPFAIRCGLLQYQRPKNHHLQQLDWMVQRRSYRLRKEGVEV